jgi:flagella basal body P-ring formation protein FlgA
MLNRLFLTASVLALAILAAAPVLAGAGKAASAGDAKSRIAGPTVDLRENVEVNGTLITLGDLFTVTGEQALIEVAYAPEPGKRAVFDARWLYRVAHAYQVQWRPLSEHVRAVVTRRSEVIGQREIEELIRDALAAKGVDTHSELELSNHFLQLHVPADTIATVKVEEAIFDSRSQRFTAILAVPSGKGGMKRTQVRGRLFTTTEVPVLNRRVLIGEVITAKDIQWVKVRSSRLQTNVIVNESDLVGYTPKRGLRAGDPVLASAVQRPILVPKGSSVTMTLRTPQMLLTAQGKALEDGANGDVVRVRNPRSKTVIEAEVVGEGRVAVRPTSLVAMN